MSPLAEAMLEKVRRYDHVSMVELCRVAKDTGIDPTGDLQLTLSADDSFPNLVIWAGVNEEFADALDEIRPYTEIDACHWLVYLVDGGMLTYPLAKRITKRGYKKPHWVPITLRMKDR